jgi:hypothetical protein
VIRVEQRFDFFEDYDCVTGFGCRRPTGTSTLIITDDESSSCQRWVYTLPLHLPTLRAHAAQNVWGMHARVLANMRRCIDEYRSRVAVSPSWPVPPPLECIPGDSLGDTDLPGFLCEVCLDAPAIGFKVAPWGGEMGACEGCAAMRRIDEG